MYNFGRNVELEYDMMVDMSPQELASYVHANKYFTPLFGEVALKICSEQILAAKHLQDEASARDYIAIRSQLIECAYGLKEQKF